MEKTTMAKTMLLEAITGKNRGILATAIDRQAILTAITQLEAQNPTPRPTEAAETLDGIWRLLYTTSEGLLGFDRFPLFKPGQIYQCIRAKDAKLYNIAEIYGLPFLEGLVSVSAQFTPVSERRVDVKFERSIIGLQRLVGYNSPANFLSKIEAGQTFPPFDWSINRGDQQGWLDITYLDADLRIGRGNEGSLYVLSKV